MLLGAIGFSVFARVRERGRSATCQSNLRQIYLATQQYVQDNDSWYPNVRDSISGSYWSYKILPYIKQQEVFYCPNFSFLAEDPYGLITYPLNQSSYNFNVWRLNSVQIGPGWVAKNDAEVEVRLNPTSTWLNYCMDMHYLNERPISEIPTTTLTASCGRKAAFIDGTHHSGGTNWSFLDGHVKWMTMQQVADMDCANPPLPPNALPQED